MISLVASITINISVSTKVFSYELNWPPEQTEDKYSEPYVFFELSYIFLNLDLELDKENIKIMNVPCSKKNTRDSL